MPLPVERPRDEQAAVADVPRAKQGSGRAGQRARVGMRAVRSGHATPCRDGGSPELGEAGSPRAAWQPDSCHQRRKAFNLEEDSR